MSGCVVTCATNATFDPVSNQCRCNPGFTPRRGVTSCVPAPTPVGLCGNRIYVSEDRV